MRFHLLAALCLALLPAPPSPAAETPPARPRVYQLMVRLFGNADETRKPGGSLAENGCGTFADINDAALASLREMGFTHVWLTGVIQHATRTDFAAAGEPADDPDIVKGSAGSPYAIRDYFDVNPDLATDPAARAAEFAELVARAQRHGLRVLIDFVPNHVARSYGSTARPDLDFGARGRGGQGDDTARFFDPANNFFYLHGIPGGPPLRLPAAPDGDGLFEPEKSIGRVTGNNVARWDPGRDDWYETVKLNYGYDYTRGRRGTKNYPHDGAPDLPVPDTWTKMDAVLAHWQAAGVDGFRCDMAHMVPAEFWRWAIARAQERRPAYFVAEAYDDDPAKLPGFDPGATGPEAHVMVDLLEAGFDSVYDDPTYDRLKAIYDGDAWANDLDRIERHPLFFGRALRYAENHDEVRLAARGHWGGIGPQVGPAATALLYALSTGPVLLYHGQETGEPAAGAEGFGGDDGRTTIFDYWSMPTFAGWVNGGKFDGGGFTAEQRDLREAYGRILHALDHPALRDGSFAPLNAANHDNPSYGRLPGETASGHWLYTCLRHAGESAVLVAVNLHPRATLRGVRVELPAATRDLPPFRGGEKKFRDLLGSGDEFACDPANGIALPDLPPLGARYFEVVPEGPRP